MVLVDDPGRDHVDHVADSPDFCVVGDDEAAPEASEGEEAQNHPHEQDEDVDVLDRVEGFHDVGFELVE